MLQKPLRTLSIYDKGNSYTIVDTDDNIHLFTICFHGSSTPQMTAIRASNPYGMIGSATYHAIKRFFGISTASTITLNLPSSGAVSLNKGSFFGNEKRTVRSAVLGQIYWSSRQVNNPWKGGRSETCFMKLTDPSGKTLVEYRDEGHTLKRMAVLEIGVELTQEGLYEVVVSGMAMLSKEQTGVRATKST